MFAVLYVSVDDGSYTLL